MTSAEQASGHREFRAPLSGLADPRRILTGEQALLLSQVTIRARDLVAAAAEGRLPTREIQVLLGYVREEVLRHASEVELRLLSHRGASEGFARLGRDHARLRSATEMLERAANGDATWSAARLAAVTQDLVCRLVGHLAAEERALAVLTADSPLDRNSHDQSGEAGGAVRAPTSPRGVT